MTIVSTLKGWARRIKRDGLTLWFAAKSPVTPWYAKALCFFVVAYALSPIDLIPDFIPVLGFVDDVLLLPALIWLAIRMPPAAVVEESRLLADQWMQAEGKKPQSIAGACLIVLLWLATAAAIGLWLNRRA